jgi:AcrR family transcriptional regulator
MVATRNTRSDVVSAAGRLFAEKGYHGTSMRDLGRELGLLGSSLYAHVASKQDLLVAVVEEGARLFQDSAQRALETDGSALVRLGALIDGHVDVVLSHQDVVRTYLNEARMLDGEHRSRVIAARDLYERAFRDTMTDGIADGSVRPDLDPKIASIFVLSILNAVERWFRPGGGLDEVGLAEAIESFVVNGIG